MSLEFGLALPQYDFSVAGRSVAWDDVVQWAQAAEGMGFGSLWLADHLFLTLDKYGGSSDHSFGLEPFTALGALAQVTGRARIGTLVVCAGLRPPALAGKALAGVDVISDGRLVAGVGAGWLEAEYAEAGVAFGSPRQRLAQLRATIRCWDGMWTGSDDAPPCRPPPRQEPRPPIWVGGKGDRLLELVAEEADGWNTVWTWTVDDWRSRSSVLDAACERAGRDPSSITRSVGLYTLVGENERDLNRRFERMVQSTPDGILDGVDLDGWRRGHLVGTVEQVQEQVAAWEAAGVASLIVGMGALPFAVTALDDLEMVAETFKGATCLASVPPNS